jgi:uncharacterized membrane protein YraQ (UPF0718 family)
VRLATLVAAITLATGFVLVARATGLGRIELVQEFVLVFASIVIEAFPFVLAGALVSSLIAVFVSERAFSRIRRLPAAVQVPGAVACAVALPVCECSSVPVARRLILRGIHPAAGIGFMLAAPAVNPIVLGSTWVAYGGSDLALKMTLARAAVGIVLALVAGLVLQRLITAPPPTAEALPDEHEHAEGTRLFAFGQHLSGDFVFMGKFLAIGAAAAALLQTVVPQEQVSRLAELPVVAPLALMGMAFLLSLCSEADAFVAISFGGFTLGSQLAFLAFGPVLDVKLAVLYGATFRKGFALALFLVVAPLLVAASVIFDLLVT